MSAPKVCSQPGCPQTAVAEGRCPQHARQPWRGAGTRWKDLPPNWRTLKASIMKRDHWRCQCEGCPRCTTRPCATRATDCDHIGDRADHRPTNLRAMCGPCHHHKTSSRGGNGAQTWD